ncbi:MAG: hypothetical protein Q8P18_30450 [Pseudomonadota bacterium]|nr:hypothetical protein [Pseudomonadota bacterium]
MPFFRLAPLLLVVACTGPAKDDTGTPDTDTDTDTDTDVEPAAVWDEHRVSTSSTLNGVYASGDGVYVAGTGAGAFVGGATDWTALITGVADDEDFSDLWGQGVAGSLELVAPATSGNVARFTGGFWNNEDLGTANHEGVGGSGTSALYVVSWGGIFAFDGSAWAFEAPPSDARLNDVWAIGADAIAVGEGGVILRRADGVWTAMTSGVTADLNAVSGVSLNDVWAVGADGVALHFDGTAWTSTATAVDEALWAVFAPASDAVYAVGSAGTALVWDGTAWIALPTGVDNNLYAVHGANSTNVWAVGNRGMVLQYKAR